MKGWENESMVKSLVQVDIESISNDLDTTFGEKLNWVKEIPSEVVDAKEIPFSKLQTLLSETSWF